MPGTRSKPRLSRTDWIEGALEVVAESGLDALAVEPLARRMGATKGSFYWHFADRGALLQAVLDHWRQDATARVITEVEAIEPRRRLESLLEHSTTPGEERLEHAIIAAAGHETLGALVGPVVDEVHSARIDYVDRLLRDLGLPPDSARTRARLVYAAYLGHLMLLSRLSEGTPRADVLDDFRRELLVLLRTPAPSTAILDDFSAGATST